MSMSNVTDMFVEIGTFRSFCAGEVETIVGDWARAEEAQNVTNKNIKTFLCTAYLRKRS